MRIGVLSDTHIPDRTDGLPTEVFDLFRGVDMILHAGDVSEQAVLDGLAAIARVVAVQGNRDKDRLPWLPQRTVVTVDHWRIGLIHGTRPRLEELADRLRYVRGDHHFVDQRRHVLRAFADAGVHCIVFGHSHQACQEVQDGVLLFNPGGVVPSPGGGPSSVGILTVSAEGITSEVIPLRHPPRSLSLGEQIRRLAAGRLAL